MTNISGFFTSTSFMPHGHCYLWRPDILWMHVLSDAMIAMAYFSIPLSLISLVRRRTDVRFSWIFALFAAFILLCGITHITEIWTTWNPAYGLQGLLKLLTGLVSIGTAVLLWSLIPKALSFPTLDQLENANQILKKEMSSQLEERDLLRLILNAQRELNKAGLDPEQCVETLLAQLKEMLHAEGVAYETLKGNELFCQTADGFLGSLKNRRLGLEGSLSGVCVRERKIISSSDSENDPRVHAATCREVGLRAMILAPLCNGNQVIGIIKAAFQSPRQFTERDIKILELLANLYESALTNALSYKAGEEAQVQTEEQFRVLADSMPQLAWMARGDGHIFWYNRRWYEYTGTTLEEMEGWGWKSVHHPDYIDQILSDVKRHWQVGKSFEMTFPLRKKTGEYRWFLTRVEPIKDSDGNVVRWFGTNTDITSQREALEEKERLIEAIDFERQRFETAMKALPAAVVMAAAPSGKIIFSNDQLERVWKHPVIPSENVDDYREYIGFHQDGRRYEGHDWPLARSVLYGETIAGEDTDVLLGDGTRGVIRISSAPIRDLKGHVIAGIVFSQNVTAEIETQRALRESEAQFRALANSLPQLCWMADRDGWIYWYNQRWYDYTGTTHSEMEGWGWEKVHHPDHVERVVQFVKDAWKRPEGWELTFPLRGANGEFRWFLTRAEPIKSDEGEIAGWFGSNTDITELRSAQDGLRRAEERLRRTLEASPIGVVLGTGEGDLSIVNDAYANLVGYSRDELIQGKVGWAAITPKEDLLLDRAAQAEARLHGVSRPYEKRYRRKDGTLVDVLIACAILKGHRDGEDEFAAFTLDISDRKLAEKALRESEAKFRTIADAMPQIVWSTLPDGHHDYYNRRWYEYTGAPPGSLDGGHRTEMFHPEDQQKAWEVWRHSLETGESYEIEYRLRHHSGAYRWVLGRALPVWDEDGKIIRWMGTCTDIDDQKRAAELLEQRVRERTAELEAANKELEAFSYSVSHDLRAPLRGIDGFSEAVISLYADRLDEQGQDFLRRIRAAIQRMGQLIDEMLTLSRVTRREMQRTEVDLSALVRAIADDLLTKEPERQVTFHIEPGLKAKADPVLLRTTLENLLGNAWKFTSKRENSNIIFGSQNRSGQTVFFVKDNGAGFNMEYGKKLFVAFQRLHRQTEFPGTGIGLATVQRVIHRHGGRVWGEGKEGEGATFYFTLGDNSK